MRLFPRKHGPAKTVQQRIRATAHMLLDRAKAGDEEAQKHIDWALRVTGDLAARGMELKA